MHNLVLPELFSFSFVSLFFSAMSLSLSLSLSVSLPGSVLLSDYIDLQTELSKQGTTLESNSMLFSALQLSEEASAARGSSAHGMR